MNFGSFLRSVVEISRIQIEGRSIENLIFGQPTDPPIIEGEVTTVQVQQVNGEGPTSQNSALNDESSSDFFLTTPQLIEKNGYVAEIHEVTTEDGYILTLHRIPCGKNEVKNPQKAKPVVLLQQGVLSSSGVWVMNSVEKSLAYRLADQGFDVFIGNSRGTTYSKGHVSLDVKSAEYWDFSWSEMGQFDLPANIDYILDLTGQPDLQYVGHSMGTTLFFAGMALRPEYHSKIRLMSALAPVAFCENITSPVSLLAPYINQLDWLSQYLGIRELLPNSPLVNYFGMAVGHELSPLKEVYPNIFYYLCGEDSGQMNKKVLPILTNSMPAGISVKSLSHYAQGINEGEFRQYNYGSRINRAVYGQPSPPSYDLSKINIPIAIYYAESDLLSTQPDIERLCQVLPNVVHRYQIELQKFNHMDFLWATEAPELLYAKMEDKMRQFITT